MPELIGSALFIIAGTLWGIELIPQLIKTYRLKRVGDISGAFLAITLTAYVIFMAGCVLKGEWALFYGHIFPVVNVIVLCVMYRVYKQ